MTFPSNDHYYRVPSLAKNLGHTSAANFIGNHSLDPDDYKNGKDFMQTNSDNDTVATLLTDRGMGLTASSKLTGGFSTYGVPAYVPGLYGESIINVVFDAILGNECVGICTNWSDATLYNSPDQTASPVIIAFSGTLSKVIVNVCDGDPLDSRSQMTAGADSGASVNLYNSAAVTTYDKTARAKYAFKIILSKGTITGARVIFSINDVLQDVCDLIVDADLDFLTSDLICPFFMLHSATSAVGMTLYQYAVQRV